MRLLIAAVLIGLLAIPALAGQNPDIRCYIDFAPPGYVHRADPTPGVPTEAFIVLDNFGSCDPGVGMTAISLKVTPDPGIATFIIYECLLTDCLAIGGWEEGTTVSATECMVCDGSTPANPGIVLVAKMTIFPTGTPGDILIEDHPDFPRWVVDCAEPVPEVDYYCVLSHAGLYQDPSVPGDCPEPDEPDAVVCEPQGGGNPTHPPTYWYDVTPGNDDVCDFHVKVADPAMSNYTAIVTPTNWDFTVQVIGDDTWASWYNEGCTDPLPADQTFRFQFDHNGEHEWYPWTTTGSGTADPFDGILDEAENHNTEPNGFGYLVHGPMPASAVESKTWGTIKTLFR